MNTAKAIAVVIVAGLAARAQASTHSESAWASTLNVSAVGGATVTKTVPIPTPLGATGLISWRLGVDSRHADAPGMRLSCELLTGPRQITGEPPPPSAALVAVSGFLYRSGPGRPMHDSQSLAAPLVLQAQQQMWLRVTMTQGITNGSVAARCNVFAFFVLD